MNFQTVTGPAAVEAIEFADGHGHVWIDPAKSVAKAVQLPLKNATVIEAELKDFRLAGGSLIVDCQPGGAGRDGQMLKKLSEAAAVHLTATTGFHLEKYYQPDFWLWQASEHQAADFFVAELTSGLAEASEVLASTIKVGFSGKIEGQTQTLMEAVAEAAGQTGALILIHTERGENAEALLPFFDKRGVSPERLYVCHLDKRPDLGLHQELAQAGALLGYDTFIRSTYKPREHVWPLLKAMTEAGLAGHIAIGLDLALSSMWRHFGGQPGLIALPELIWPGLRQAEIEEADIVKLIGQNIARYLVRPSDIAEKTEIEAQDIPEA